MARHVQTNNRQQEGLSRFKDDKRKPDQETVASSDKAVESKNCQGQRGPRNHGGNSRARGVSSRSYKFFLVFVGGVPLSRLETSASRHAWALLGLILS